jgi:hypothetical protein
MLNRSKTWAIALLVATFAAGAIVGAGGRAVWARYAHATAPGRGRIDRMKADLDRELRLTGAARDSVHAVVDRHWSDIKAAWEAVRPRFDSMRAQMDSDITRQLTPEQQARYRDLMAGYRHHREKAHPSRKQR